MCGRAAKLQCSKCKFLLCGECRICNAKHFLVKLIELHVRFVRFRKRRAATTITTTSATCARPPRPRMTTAFGTAARASTTYAWNARNDAEIVCRLRNKYKWGCMPSLLCMIGMECSSALMWGIVHPFDAAPAASRIKTSTSISSISYLTNQSQLYICILHFL